MNGADIAAIAGQFGPLGVFIWYLVAQQKRQDEIAERRIKADMEVAEALTLMRAILENLRRVP